MKPNAIVLFSGVAMFVAVSCAVPPDDTPVDEDQTGGGGTTPGVGGNAGTPPTAGTSQGGTTPGVGGTTPGVGGTTPGVGGTTPGVGGTTPVAGSGGTTPVAGSGGTAPVAGMGGTTATGGDAGTPGAGNGTGGTGTTTCMPNPPAQTCGGTAAPTDGVVIDFASFQTSGTWGVSGMGDLTGGTSYYQGRGVTQLTAVVEAGSLHITGSLPAYTADIMDDAENYAGIVFWFGPCVNASAFTGLSLPVSGTLASAALKLQVQTHLDYPVDAANSKGGCSFTSCDTRWSECVGPTTTVTVPSAPATFAWSAFTGGKPNAAVTPEGLVGLQFQFECSATTAPCTVDVTLGTITLTM
jgi:hypothetical protein